MRLLGLFLISLPFLVIAVVAYEMGGVMGVVIPFGLVLAAIAVLYAGVYLVMEER